MEGLEDQFFRIALSHDSLLNYYKTNFAMMQHHKYSLTEVENMIPFEREIYVNFLKQWINERIEKQKLKQSQENREDTR